VAESTNSCRRGQPPTTHVNEDYLDALRTRVQFPAPPLQKQQKTSLSSEARQRARQSDSAGNRENLDPEEADFAAALAEDGERAAVAEVLAGPLEQGPLATGLERGRGLL